MVNKNEPVYAAFEDDYYVCCFLEHNPFNERHILIVPKKHYYDVDKLDDATAKSVMKASIVKGMDDFEEKTVTAPLELHKTFTVQNVLISYVGGSEENNNKLVKAIDPLILLKLN
ncbi:HIT domain-containing protein [Gracilibacillus orientalis]|uniref:HIT domain-containing protein n=1 Tax=Gracilibacillus orientalis TaxID=334253 RepID=UPI001FEBB3B7|nr:HIT domain-containing protein [Gracilibacillus orientalis]